MATITSAGAPRSFSSPAITVRRITFSSSYTTGGETVTPAQVGLGQVFAAIANARSASAGAVAEIYYDAAGQRLMAFTATAEVANATNLSGITADVIFFGKP